VAAILRIASDSVNNYGTSNNMVVIDREDLLKIAIELEE